MLRIILLILLFFPLSGSSQVILTDEVSRIQLDTNFSVLTETTREMSVQEALVSTNFIPNTHASPNLGLSDHSIWIKFTVANRSTQSHFLLDVAYPVLDEVELFTIADTGKSAGKESMGLDRPFHSRAYNHPNYIFDINIPPGDSKDYILRVKSFKQIILPLSINTPVKLWEYLGQESTLWGIYFGIVLIMVVYNFFLFLSVKDKGYLYYVVYVAFLGLTQLGIRGFNFQFFWPGHPDWESLSIILFACSSSIAVLFFTDHFLHLKRNAGWSRPFLVVLLVLFSLGIVTAVAGFRQTAFRIMQYTTTAETIILFIVSLYVVRKGYKPARYFFIAWSVLLTGSLIFLLKDYGVLPYNIYTSVSFQAASVIEMSLLSFALAARINELKKEKEASQAQALHISKENEKLIREQNVVLEQKVLERTQELRESNETLQQTLVNLQETQSQLVESEKMASLGQLTAGVAHEINNPINFVTSNVTPLRRDLRMVLDALSAIEQIGLSDLSPAEKQQQIDAYKEDLDFDYLKEEIDHLLNGMYEGATRTSEIVKSLRIFSRVDEDALKMADINECLDSTLVIVNSLINDKNIRVEKGFGDLPQVECYPGKLNQVFLNIISNAIYAIDKQHHGNRKGTLSIRSSLDGPYVIITIKDNGTGMDEKTKEKMFEPFFTTKDVGEGTGLGMSIVYNTIKKHNGDILVDSAPGEGAAFTLKIPLQQKK